MTKDKTLHATPHQAGPTEPAAPAPAATNGGVDGSAQAEAGSQAGPSNAVPPAASEPEAPATAVRAHLLGEPDSLPEVWCANCKADVKPKGRGQCPRCGRVLKMSFLARKGPVNVLRRDEFLANIIKQFPPADILERATCEQLASTLERIEGTKAGGSEWQRLVQVAQNLGATLRDAKQHRATPTDDNLAALSDEQLIKRAEALLTYARETKQLSDLVESRQAEDRERLKTLAAASPNDARDETQPAAPAAVPAPESRITDAEEREEEAAEIRRRLGWDVGVLNERTGYRYHE